MTVFWLITAYLAGVATPFVVVAATYIVLGGFEYPESLEKEVKS